MISRRQILGLVSLLGSAVYGYAVNEPKKLGHVGDGQKTALQPQGSQYPITLALVAEKMIERHRSGEAPLSLYDVEIRRATRTGSMRPAIGDNDILLVERAPYSDLRLGDLVEGSNESARLVASMGGEWDASHRIVGGKPGAWVTRGDNNSQRDPFPLTPKTYTGWRTIAVLYSFKPDSLK